jgi:hypothetical protein
LFSCVKPVEIVIPDGFQQIPALPVTGSEKSWKLDFGGFHAYNITDSNSRVFLTDARNMSYDIRSFEYFMNTAGSTQYRCYCEFPMKALDDETFRCIFENVYNQFDIGRLTDRIINSQSGDITIEEYYEYHGMKPNSKNTLVGYIFLDSGNQVGLVDVSNINNETVWINPGIEMHKQVMIAAGATSLILKHRKWYQAFYESSDRDVQQNF